MDSSPKTPSGEEGVAGATPQRESRGQWLAFVVERPVAITMFIVAIAVFGFVSLGKLRVDLLPEISYPTVTVRTTYKGAAPEDIEDRVSERIQEALSTLPHLVRSTSISRAEVSDIVLDFDWGTAMTFAVQDIRDKLDSVFLPEGAERPLILRYDPNLDPILRIGLSLPEHVRNTSREKALIQLRWLAEHRIQRELEGMPGVAAVQIRGGLIEEIRVRNDPFKMAAQGLDPAKLAARLAQENINASGGLIREGSTEYLVRTLNEFENVAEIEELALERRGEATIRVRDVATVERTHAEREVVTTISGAEAVEIAIYREAGANIVELAEGVKQKLFGDEAQQAAAKKLEADAGRRGPQTVEEREQTDFLAWRLRDEARVSLLSDQSTFIKAAVDDVKSSAVVGAILAVAVIWLFLRRLAGTFVIGVAIPVSVVVTFAPMYLQDVTLNIMSLGGLALGVGMLVDNAIVVLESITRCRSEGDPLARAALRGVSEVAGAVASSTLTTVAVFAPIVFVHGIAGQIFGDQAVTVVWSLLVSLLVAITFIPMLASRGWLAGEASGASQVSPPPIRADLSWSWGRLAPNLLLVTGRSLLWLLGLLTFLGGAVFKGLGILCSLLLKPVHGLFDFLWGAVERSYPAVIRGALRMPVLVVLTAVALSAVAAWRVPGLGLELLPEIRQGEFTLYTTLGVGTPLESTEQVMSRLEQRVRALPGVQATALTVGVEKDTLTRDIEGKHTARLTVRVAPLAVADGREEALLSEVRALVASEPAVRSIDVRRPTPFALDAPITVEILGHDLEKLEDVAAEVFRRISSIPGIEDVRSTVRPGHPEARISFDREKTLQYGLDLDQVSRLVRDQVLGNVSTRFDEGDEKIDVRVQGDEVLLASLDQVLDLVVNPGAATPVELRSVASIERVQGPAEIRRMGNTRAVLVTASGGGLDLGGLNRQIESQLASMTPPEDVTVQLGGQKRELDEAQSSLRFALFLAVFLVYVVMACQFESLVQPLIVLVTVPLALVGVVFTLDLLQVPISVTVFLGVILLAGIVVNNAIVLIDRVNQQRAAGRGVTEALADAGATRLRPILMTTATTVLGLLPLTGWFENVPGLSLLSSGEGAEIRAPMAITVIAGLTVSTLLTLVVIPAVYALVYRRAERARHAS